MNWPAAISIKEVALTLMGGLLLLVSLIGAYAAYQTRTVTRNLEQHSQDSARAELSNAVQRMLSQAKESGDHLANWDETRQQLVQPEYYAYWRDDRVYTGGKLNRGIAKAALYTPSGELLTDDPGEIKTPPRLSAGIQPDQAYSWLINESGTIALYHVFPVFSDVQSHSLLGHGLIRIDFMQALLHQGTLHFTDMSSVALALKPGETLEASKLMSRLHFSARTDPDQLRFQTILSRTLLALLVLLIAASLLGSVIYNRLLVRPMRQLSDDIDAMQLGHLSHHPM
jgi:hypothetical protein